jgi:Na+-translocating ferredoxin:NAD+ oxidoreductase RnfD subunit
VEHWFQHWYCGFIAAATRVSVKNWILPLEIFVAVIIQRLLFGYLAEREWDFWPAVIASAIVSIAAIVIWIRARKRFVG